MSQITPPPPRGYTQVIPQPLYAQLLHGLVHEEKAILKDGERTPEAGQEHIYHILADSVPFAEIH